MVREEDISTVRLSKKTISRLRKYGEYGDSMDSIVSKLLDRLDRKLQ